MSQYFPPYRSSRGDIKVELDLSNYGTKTDLKNVTHVDVNSFTSKTNLASLKTEVDEIDAVKLKTVPVDLVKLNNVVKNDVVKKTEYDKLVGKVNNIDTKDFVKKTKYEKDGSDSEEKISKIDKKIPDVSSLVKKTVYNTKISEIENKVNDHNHYKYITTPEFNTMVTDIFNARLAAQADLIRKPEFDFKLKGISNTFGNLWVCLMKGLVLMLHPTIKLLQN